MQSPSFSTTAGKFSITALKDCELKKRKKKALKESGFFPRKCLKYSFHFPSF